MELKHYTYQNGLKEETLQKHIEDRPTVLKATGAVEPLDAICATGCETVYLRGANDALIVVEKEDSTTESGTSISQKVGRWNPFAKGAHETRMSETPYDTIRSYFMSAGIHGLRGGSIIVDDNAFNSALDTKNYENLVALFSNARPNSV